MADSDDDNTDDYEYEGRPASDKSTDSDDEKRPPRWISYGKRPSTSTVSIRPDEESDAAVAGPSHAEHVPPLVVLSSSSDESDMLSTPPDTPPPIASESSMNNSFDSYDSGEKNSVFL